MNRLLTTKGLFVRPIGECRFVLEDAHGLCLMPIISAADDSILEEEIKRIANVKVMCAEHELNELSSPSSFSWHELEKYYVARLTDKFRSWQVGRQRVREYDLLTYLVPQGFADLGFGDGAKRDLETLNQDSRAKATSGNTPYTIELLQIYLAYVQLRRVCQDLMALLHRAMTAFYDVLSIQRAIVQQESSAMALLSVPEIVHSGPKAYRVSSAATMCVLSLCTSLDVSSKLLYFFNNCHRPVARFRYAQGKHFSDIVNLRSATLPASLVGQIKALATGGTDIKALIQARHDLIHNTTALELERVFIGFATPQVKEQPLHYAEIHWRDCQPCGQPDRCLGRDYFTSKNTDMELQLQTWIQQVVKYHLTVGHLLDSFMASDLVDDVGVKLTNGRRIGG